MLYNKREFSEKYYTILNYTKSYDSTTANDLSSSQVNAPAEHFFTWSH